MITKLKTSVCAGNYFINCLLIAILSCEKAGPELALWGMSILASVHIKCFLGQGAAYIQVFSFYPRVVSHLAAYTFNNETGFTSRIYEEWN